MNKEKLEKLGEELKKLPKPQINENKKNILKKSILHVASTYSKEELKGVSVFYSLHKLIHSIKKLAGKVLPDKEKLSYARARILALAEAHPQKNLPIISRVFTLKKATALTMVFVLSMMSFMFLFLDRNVVYAKETTVIEEMFGEVTVVRDGVKIQAEPDMKLEEGDVIKTSSNGFAVIRYFDDKSYSSSSKCSFIIAVSS